MKNRILKRSIALIISVILVIQTAGAVFAEPSETVSGDGNAAAASEEITVSENLQKEASEVTENEPEQPEAADAGTEETADEEPADEKCADTPEETVSENDSFEEKISDDAVEEGSGREVLFAAGSLDTDLLFSHLDGVEEEIYEDFSELPVEAAGIDYAENRAYFEAEDEDEAVRIAAEYGEELESFCEGIGVITFDTDELSLSDAVACSLYDGDIDTRIYPDHINRIFDEPQSTIDTNDPKYNTQWQHNAISDNEAWKTTRGKGIKVAVIDTGISQEHEDLKDNIAGAYACGYDTPEDENNHGSHCAGIIAAVADNNKGGVGVAPDAKIVSIRAANAGGNLFESDVVSAVNKAVDEGVNVISMSFGSKAASEAEKKALKKAYDKGITLVASAGNKHESAYNYPAGFDFIISVASYDKDGGLSSFSNFGDWVDLAAPGGSIYSCAKNGGYVNMSGTSMACPMVSGVVAMMYASDPYYTDPANANSDTPKMIREALIQSCDRNGYERNDQYGYRSVLRGLRAEKAVKYAIGTVKDANVKVETPENPVINTAADPKSGAVTVEFSGIEKGTECYYTTDGKAPTTASMKYTGTEKIIFSDPGQYTVKVIAVNKAPITIGYKYAMSSVVSKKFKVVRPKNIDYEASELFARVDIDKNISMIPGGSIKLPGIVSPDNASTKKITYELEGTPDGAITVDGKGVVKVSKDAPEGTKARIKLGISGKDLPDANCDTVEITVRAEVISEMASSFGSDEQTVCTVLPRRENITAEPESFVTSIDIAASMAQKPGGGVVYRYESSNKKAAVVDRNGIVKAVGNGKSDITVTAMDGSKRKIIVKINCITPVVDMTVTPPGNLPYVKIARGRSIKFTPVFSGTGRLKPSNRKVTWTTDSENVKVDKKGKVTATKNAYAGEKVTIYCISDDGSVKVTSSYSLTVKDPVKYMGILKKTMAVYRVYRYWFGYSYKKFLYYKNIYASKATGNIIFSPGQQIDVRTPASALTSGKDLVYAAGQKFTTSYDSLTKDMAEDEYIVKVKAADGLIVNSTDARGSVESIIPSKKGKYKITYQALDGSGKKFILTVKVR